MWEMAFCSYAADILCISYEIRVDCMARKPNDAGEFLAASYAELTSAFDKQGLCLEAEHSRASSKKGCQ